MAKSSMKMLSLLALLILQLSSTDAAAIGSLLKVGSEAGKKTFNLDKIEKGVDLGDNIFDYLNSKSPPAPYSLSPAQRKVALDYLKLRSLSPAQRKVALDYLKLRSLSPAQRKVALDYLNSHSPPATNSPSPQPTLLSSPADSPLPS